MRTLECVESASGRPLSTRRQYIPLCLLHKGSRQSRGSERCTVLPSVAAAATALVATACSKVTKRCLRCSMTGPSYVPRRTKKWLKGRGCASGGPQPRHGNRWLTAAVSDGLLPRWRQATTVQPAERCCSRAATCSRVSCKSKKKPAAAGPKLEPESGVALLGGAVLEVLVGGVDDRNCSMVEAGRSANCWPKLLLLGCSSGGLPHNGTEQHQACSGRSAATGCQLEPS